MTTFINQILHNTQNAWTWRNDDTYLSSTSRRVSLVFKGLGLAFLSIAICTGIAAGIVATISLIASGSLVLGPLSAATLAVIAYRTFLLAGLTLLLGDLIKKP